MNTKQVTIALAIIMFTSACTKDSREPTETFYQRDCTYKELPKPREYTYQAGCASYATDSKGQLTGGCLVPLMANQSEVAVEVSCKGQKWQAR